MLVSGQVIGLLTFPGIIVHEFGHKIFCDISGIRVREVNYFSLEGGHVIHDLPRTYSQAFFITIGPLIVNSLVAFVIFWSTNFIESSLLGLIPFWLGISIGMHAFPSDHDADNLWEYSKVSWKSNVLAIVGFPLTLLIKIANLLSFFWFDLIFALGILVLATGTIDTLSHTSMELNDFSSITSDAEYSFCSEKKGYDYCNQKLFDWCIGEFNDSSHCSAFKTCLNKEKNYSHCDSEYFITTYS